MLRRPACWGGHCESESAHARLRRLRACATDGGAHPRGSSGRSGRIFHKRPSEDGAAFGPFGEDRSKPGLGALLGGVGAVLDGIYKGFIDDVPERKKRNK